MDKDTADDCAMINDDNDAIRREGEDAMSIAEPEESDDTSDDNSTTSEKLWTDHDLLYFELIADRSMAQNLQPTLSAKAKIIA